jgi:hypothetical protein
MFLSALDDIPLKLYCFSKDELNIIYLNELTPSKSFTGV